MLCALTRKRLPLQRQAGLNISRNGMQQEFSHIAWRIADWYKRHPLWPSASTSQYISKSQLHIHEQKHIYRWYPKKQSEKSSNNRLAELWHIYKVKYCALLVLTWEWSWMSGRHRWLQLLDVLMAFSEWNPGLLLTHTEHVTPNTRHGLYWQLSDPKGQWGWRWEPLPISFL